MGAVKDIPGDMLIGAEYAAYLRQTEPEAKLIDAGAFREAFKAQRRAQQARAASLPWSKTDGLFAFRPGEVTEWVGPRGHGKSMVLSQTVLALLNQGEKAAIMSFEMSPQRQLERFVRQFSASAEPTEAAEDAMFDWLTGRLWFYNQQGRVHPDTVLAVTKYAAERKGATHVVIDSLMKVVRGADDYNAQKDLANDLCTTAQDYGPHVHLVHHTRKIGDDSRIPSVDDSKGGGEVPDQVDNILIVWRNKPKEALQAKYDQGRPLNEKELAQLDGPDCILACEKQRHGEWEGRTALWFHKPSFQYCPDAMRRPVNYLGLAR